MAPLPSAFVPAGAVVRRFPGNWGGRAVTSPRRPSTSPFCVAAPATGPSTPGPTPPTAPTPPTPPTSPTPIAPPVPPSVRTPQAAESSPREPSSQSFPPRPRPTRGAPGGGDAPGRGERPGFSNRFADRGGGGGGPGGERRESRGPRESRGAYGDREQGQSRGGYGDREQSRGRFGDREQSRGGQEDRGARGPRKPYPPGVATYTECGKCSAAYEISGDELTEQGRKVVCAVCSNSWFQRPDSLRLLREGAKFRDYPLDRKEEFMASRAERAERRGQGGPGGPGAPGGRSQYGDRTGAPGGAGGRQQYGDRAGGPGGGRFDRDAPRRSYGDRSGGGDLGERREPQRTYGGPGGDRAAPGGSGYQGRSRAGNGQHTLFIGNIPFTISSGDLEQLLRSAGGFERVSLVTDPEGRSKGFAFADMKSEADVQHAVDTLNGYEMDGRQLTVRVGRKNGP